MLTIYQGDNLDYLRRAAESGERFDLVELDGPYGAGLEAWDSLSEAEYVAHYAERLTLVRQVLQPWGVVFLFGYPEMVALVRAWAVQAGYGLRRWLNWYKQRSMHKGRKVETIVVWTRDAVDPAKVERFRTMLRAARGSRTLEWVGAEALRRGHTCWWHRGGNMYFETGSGNPLPSLQDYIILADIFGFDPDEWAGVIEGSYEGITDLDFLSAHYPERTRGLNDAGLRSKPMGLYADLFRPVVPPREQRRALILYGGLGNAAFAAGKLGYDVDVCESDPARCERIRRDWAWEVERRDETPVSELGPLFNQEAAA